MKTSLVLLSGLLCDADMWAHQAKVLADIADITLPDLSQHDSMEMLAESVLADAPARFALAGLSMGGYVAFEILRRAPERVERLALFDTKPEPDTPEQTEGRKRMIELAQSGRFEEVLAGFLPKVVSSKCHCEEAASRRSNLEPRANDSGLLRRCLAMTKKEKTVLDVLHAMAERMGPEGYVRQQKAIMGRADSRPDLARIKCPTLVIAGAEDKLTPPESMRAWAAQIPGARFEVVENAGHMTPLEQPEAVSDLMRDWLSAP